MARLSQKTRILNTLLEAKGKLVFMRILNRIAYNYTARISELRKDGYKIEPFQHGVGSFSYFIPVIKKR